MRNYFQFGTTKFDIDDGLVIEKVPNQNRPARKMDVYNVPGRNGDIVVMQDAWENVEQTYEIWGGNENINSATGFGYKVAELFNQTGYQRLEDSYDPDHYRLAYFAGPFDVENLFTRRGRAQLTFSCDPRRFLVQQGGEYVIDATHFAISSPVWFPSKPRLIVYGSGSGTITVQDKTMTISNITNGMYIDSETYSAYYNDTNLNTVISGDFIEFPGKRDAEDVNIYGEPMFYVDFTGGILAITAQLQWWEL